MYIYIYIYTMYTYRHMLITTLLLVVFSPFKVRGSGFRVLGLGSGVRGALTSSAFNSSSADSDHGDVKNVKKGC